MLASLALGANKNKNINMNLNICIGGVQSKRPHHGAQLPRNDRPLPGLEKNIGYIVFQSLLVSTNRNLVLNSAKQTILFSE